MNNMYGAEDLKVNESPLLMNSHGKEKCVGKIINTVAFFHFYPPNNPL